MSNYTGNGQYSKVLSRLKGLRQTGEGSYQALCPAHDDKNPSLSLDIKDKLLIHCHAGCTALAVMEALGLTLADLFDELSTDFRESHYVREDSQPVFIPTASKKKSKRSGLIEVVGWLTETGHVKTNLLSSGIEIGGKPISEGKRVWLRLAFTEDTDLPCSRMMMNDAISYVSEREENEYDPLKDYFNGLEWDGVQRLEHVLVNALGAEDIPYNREITKRFIVSAAERATDPGKPHRLMLILSGSESIGKSMFCRDLCPNEDWFTDFLPRELYSVRAVEALLGKFIVESAELVSMRKSEQEAIKAFLSRQIDDARLAYRRDPENIVRRCVIIGTTNNESPIPNDAEWTRYWPVRVGISHEYEREWLMDTRDQIWAEAYSLAKSGYKWWSLDNSLKLLISKHRDLMREHDAFEDLIDNIDENSTYTEWLSGLEKMQLNVCDVVSGKEHRLETSLLRVSKFLDVPTERLSMPLQKRIGELMRKCGWNDVRAKRGGKTVRIWVK